MSDTIHHKTQKRYETGNPASMELPEVDQAHAFMLAKLESLTKDVSRAKTRIKELERAKEALKREEEEKAERAEIAKLLGHAKKSGKRLSQLTPKDLVFVFGEPEEAPRYGSVLSLGRRENSPNA
ncbi:MAG: hypothetical protein DDT34_01509 [Firmicutes bacterium]|nr:hypothetical protein [Bacillota bacterium]